MPSREKLEDALFYAVDGGSGDPLVFVRRISLVQAVVRLRKKTAVHHKRNGIYTPREYHARALAGLVFTSKSITDAAHTDKGTAGEVYYDHYHPGGRGRGFGHIWYGPERQRHDEPEPRG